MNLIDRLSIQRIVQMLLNFILTIIKLFAPSKNGEQPKPKPRLRWRLKKND